MPGGIGHGRTVGIGTRLTLAFGVLVGVTLLVGALTWTAGSRVTGDIDQGELLRGPASLASAQAPADLLRMQLHVRGYLVLGDPADMAQYRAARRAFEADLAALRSMSDQWPEVEDAQAIRALTTGYREWVELAQRLFDLHDSPPENRPALRLARVEVQARLARILDAVDRIVELQALRERESPGRGLLADLRSFQTSLDAMATNLMAYGESGEVSFELAYGSRLATNAAAWRALSARRASLDPRQRALLDVIARDRAEMADLALQIGAIINGGHADEDLYLYRAQLAPQADVLLRRLAELRARQQAQLGSSLANARLSLASARLVAAVAGALAVAIAVAVAYAFRRSIVVPLRRLTRAAERVAAGDLAARAGVESNDEVGLLARAIDTMTERLSNTIHRLETICAEAQEARTAAEAANRAKSRFLAHMSHELRTPLNAVLGYAQILQDEPGLSDFQSDRLQKIRSGGEHLLAMINDVLDLSRIEAGRMELQRQPMSLSGLLRAVCGVARAAAERKGLSFASELAADLPAVVDVDGRRLEQVLLNLLDNAVKVTERGRVSLCVRRLEAAGQGLARLQFAVADSGIGIAPGRLAELFRPFEAAGDTTRQHPGAGLGLALSQRIVAMMGGHVEVESQLGQGSLFRFELEVGVVEAGAAPGLPGGGEAQDAIWRRLLVVGPASAGRAELAASLAACGFELVLADGPGSALEQARLQCTDLVLVQIGPPDAPGQEAIRRLRRDPSLRELPVIALSSSPGGTAALANPDDADAVLCEPVDVAALAATIGDLRQRRRQASGPLHPGPGAAALVVPGADELERLYTLARTGNMRSIGEQADYLAGLDPRYLPFAQRLRDLAQRFQSRAILDWISELRRNGSDGVTPSVRRPTAGL